MFDLIPSALQCENRPQIGSEKSPARSMPDPRSASAESVFAGALERLTPGDRERYLDDACAGRPDLRREVDSLLRAHQEAHTFLGWSPLVGEPAGANPGLDSVPVPTVRATEGATAFPAARTPESTPPRITGFRLDRCLGQGGLGSVFEAWDEKLQRRVAIKTLHAFTNATAEARRRVLDEARKLAALRDPAIVTVHAVLDDHEPPAIVMELVEGYAVDRATEGFTFAQKARVLQEIARALAEAHDRGILHRDLKPANVLVTPGLKPVILDFGLALSLREGEQPGRGFEGTPLYASPEQVRGGPLTPAADVFSLGSLMFKVLTGAVPFPGGTLADVLEAITRAAPPFLRDVALGVPTDLQAICLACLARESEKRPTARQVALELGRFLAGEPVRLRPALYSDILRRRISEYSNDLLNWEQQGMISPDERDRLQLVHRRILADEDHWLIDTRRLTLTQTLLYTSTWLVVIAAALVVWLIRDEVAPVLRWSLPTASSLALLAIGLRAESRREELASAAFLAGAVLSVVPTSLALLAEGGVLTHRPDGVTQLFATGFTNPQLLLANLVGLILSLFALWRLRMTGFAWTTCALGAASFLSALLLFNWLGQEPQVMAAWLLPLVGFSGVALAFEKSGRIRWALPYHVLALLVLIGALDVIAIQGPTFSFLGVPATTTGFLNEDRQRYLSLALNGVVYLGLMFATENARSLDLRRGSRVLEIAALAHVLGGLYQNAQHARGTADVRLDVALYLGAVVVFLILGPWRSRWRMLVGAMTGLALGSYLLLDLDLVPRQPFIIALGILGLGTAVGAYLRLVVAPRRRG